MDCWIVWRLAHRVVQRVHHGIIHHARHGAIHGVLQGAHHLAVPVAVWVASVVCVGVPLWLLLPPIESPPPDARPTVAFQPLPLFGLRVPVARVPPVPNGDGVTFVPGDYLYSPSGLGATGFRIAYAPTPAEGFARDTVRPVPISEPPSALLLGIAAVMIGVVARRRRAR